MTLHLRESDNGTSVRVPLSEEVVLELEENPTTGYRWMIETTGDAVSEIESNYVPSSGTAIGGGGRRSVRFIAARPGTTEIRAALRRSWEPPERSLKQFAVTIHVEGDSDADDQ
jgi:inhibitor of cysteine peptidase